jgi:hypothetical protein
MRKPFAIAEKNLVSPVAPRRSVTLHRRSLQII